MFFITHKIKSKNKQKTKKTVQHALLLDSNLFRAASGLHDKLEK